MEYKVPMFSQERFENVDHCYNIEANEHSFNRSLGILMSLRSLLIEKVILLLMYSRIFSRQDRHAIFFGKEMYIARVVIKLAFVKLRILSIFCCVEILDRDDILEEIFMSFCFLVLYHFTAKLFRAEGSHFFQRLRKLCNIAFEDILLRICDLGTKLFHTQLLIRLVYSRAR